MNISITGSSGFIGKKLVKKLTELHHSITEFDKRKFNLFSIDSLKDFVVNKDVIIHLGGVNKGTYEELFNGNVITTKNLLEAMQKYNSKAKFIFSSSAQVYCDDSYYGFTKKIAEELIRFFTYNYSMRSVIFRLSNVYGKEGRPFYNSVIATFLYQVKKNENLTVNGSGNQKRDYIYIDDVLSAFEKSISKSLTKNYEVFDICYGKQYSIRDIISILEKNSRRRIAVTYNLNSLQEKKMYVMKNSKAKKELFWNPIFNLEKGIKKIFNEN